MKPVSLLASVFFLSLLLPGDGAAAADQRSERVPSLETLTREIKEFARVDENLYRGSQPSEEDLALLKAFGIKTLINFRNEVKMHNWERRKAAQIGLHYIHLPWRIQRKPKAELMKQFLDGVGKKEMGPFFMHCKRGVERTGVADALYRYYRLNLPRKEAYQQAMKGHHRLWYWRFHTRKRYRDFIQELGPRP